jgi:hypothetical protein
MLTHDLIQQYWKFKRSRDMSKQLQLWTASPVAHEQSQDNFDQLLALAQQQGCAWMILRPKQVQFVGGNADLRQIFNLPWAEHYDKILDDPHSYYQMITHLNRLNQNWLVRRLVSHFRCYSPTIVTDRHQGFWRVETGERMTNRLDQMDVIWDAGFLARRGWPLTCAQPSQYGTRDSIEHLGRMDRRQLGSSDHIYRRLDQLYRSVNRDCCWPSSP